jgi:hypothetical protein
MIDKDIAEWLSEMIYAANKAKDLLMQSKELPLAKEIFGTGELTSIDQIAKRLEKRLTLLIELQKELL